MSKEAGHTFLAKLGKTRLRPGGKEATDWLIQQGAFSQDKQVLEVACNMCTTSIYLAHTYGCHIQGVDINKKALEKHRKIFQQQVLNHIFKFNKRMLLNCPLMTINSISFLNEAMLTMLPIAIKGKSITRVLPSLKAWGYLVNT